MTSGSNRRPAARITRPAMLLVLAGLCMGMGMGASAWARHHRSSHDDAAEKTPEAEPQAAQKDGEDNKEAEQQSVNALIAAAKAVTDFPAAVKKVEDAYRQSPGPDVLFQLGVLADAQHKTAEAQDFMRRYLADPLTDANAAGRVEAERIMALPRPPSGEVQLLSDRQGLVSVDDRLVGTMPLPAPLLLPPGNHVISLEVRDRTMKGKVKVLDGRGMEASFSRASGVVVVTLPPAVILLPEYAGPPTAPEVQRRFQQTIEQAIQKARLAVFSKDVALAHSPKLGDCLSTLPCQAQLATENEVDYTLSLKIEHTGGAGPAAAPGKENFSLDMQLIDAETADVAATAKQSCQDCTSDQVTTSLLETVRKLIQDGQGRSRGTLVVTSDPPGANIRIGDRLLGQTPYTHATFTGSYELLVEKPEFQPQRTQVEVKDGKQAKVELTLRANEPPPPPVVKVPPKKPVRPLWRLITGGALLGAGVLVAGFGISALAVNGQCVADPIAPAVVCLSRFTTPSVGAGLLVPGLAAAVAGAVLLALPPKAPAESGGKQALRELEGPSLVLTF